MSTTGRWESITGGVEHDSVGTDGETVAVYRLRAILPTGKQIVITHVPNPFAGRPWVSPGEELRYALDRMVRVLDGMDVV